LDAITADPALGDKAEVTAYHIGIGSAYPRASQIGRINNQVVGAGFVYMCNEQFRRKQIIDRNVKKLTICWACNPWLKFCSRQLKQGLYPKNGKIIAILPAAVRRAALIMIRSSV
jgi:hypothetical protein